MAGKLNKAMIELVSSEIQKGNFVAVACRKAKISRPTFYEWREKGQTAREEGKHRSIYARFLDSIEEAEAIAESDLVEEVRQTKRGPLEILKRRFRDRWGDKIVNEMTGPDGRPLEDTGSQNVEVHLHMAGAEGAEPWETLESEDEETAEIGKPVKVHAKLPPLSPPKRS
jgi:hypothetical protein